MDKDKLWIVSFQHTSGETIRCTATCVKAKDIKEALRIANDRIWTYVRDYDGEHGTEVITDIGIADEVSEDLMYSFWPDPINDPDPELFK